MSNATVSASVDRAVDRTVGAPRWLAILLIVTGASGLTAAFALSVERLERALNPDVALACDINPFLSCSRAMESWQGALFGFPNPFLGVMCFVAPIAVGVATLAGARFARWFWAVFTAGVVLGLIFVLWLAYQSLFVLALICPWCFLAWMSMYAMTFPLVIWGLGSGALPAGAGVRRWAAKWTEWSWVLSLGLAVIVVLTAIVKYPDVVRFLFR